MSRNPQHLMATEPHSGVASTTPESYGRLGVFTAAEEWDERLFAAMRCLLVFAALAIVYVDPAMPRRFAAETYAVLAGYCVFASIVALDAFTGRRLPWRERIYWGDVLFASVLMYLTEALSSVFFLSYLFAILVGSFLHGFREGLRVISIALIMYVVLGILPAPWLSELEIDRALLSPVYLLALGYMIAVWGGRQLLLKRRLMLLKEANTFNPRFGVEHALQSTLARLLDFYSAERCVLTLRQGEENGRWVMYSVGADAPGNLRVYPMTADSARTLLAFDHLHSLIYDGARSGHRSLVCLTREAREPGRSAPPPAAEACEAVAGLLETSRFVSVPCCEGDAGRGRLFVAGGATRFARSDVDFLLHYLETMGTVIKNIRLMEELVHEAAAHERSRISRDLHDATLQPYVGLRLALEALQRDAGADNPLAARIARLLDQANATVTDLRSYTNALSDGGKVLRGSLQAALESLAERYRRFYGMDVSLGVELQAELQGRVATDTFYIVLEGLNNILKHTSARRARIRIASDGGIMSITIASEGGEPRAEPVPFSPRSIMARAHELGGSVHAEERPDGSSLVEVVLPMGPDLEGRA
jgi:signal transduction histidine kinase